MKSPAGVRVGLCAGALFVAGFGTNVAADVAFDTLKRSTSGAWEANKFRNSSSGEVFCAAETHSGSSVLRVNFYRNGDAFLEIMDPTWRLRQGEMSFGLHFGEYSTSLRGTSWGNALTHDFFDEQDMLFLIALLATESRVTVRSPNGAPVQTFSLAGSSRAIAVLADCINGRW